MTVLGSSRSRGFILTALLLLLVIFLLAVVGMGLYVLKLDGTVREKFEGKRWAIPARGPASSCSRSSVWVWPWDWG